MIEAARWDKNGALPTAMASLARAATWRQRRAEVQTSQSEASWTVRGHLFAVLGVRSFEELTKCVLSSNRCSRCLHEASWRFVEKSQKERSIFTTTSIVMSTFRDGWVLRFAPPTPSHRQKVHSPLLSDTWKSLWYDFRRLNVLLSVSVSSRTAHCTSSNTHWQTASVGFLFYGALRSFQD